MKVWIGGADGGQLIGDAAASVSVFDHGLTVGDGVFETLKVTEAGPFAVQRHLDRLTRSGAAIGLTVPSQPVLREAIDAVWQANRAELGDFGRLRVTVTAGEGPLGSERGGDHASLIVATTPQRPWPATATVITVPWVRNERGALVGVKSTSYAENVIALRFARQRGGDEGLFLNSASQLSEGTSTNIFCVRAGQIVTPPLSSGCLAGITRSLVLEWSKAQEAELTLADALEADEVFITSSTRDVQPVTRLDDRTWSAPGPVSSRVAAEFRRRAREEIDP